MKKKKRKTGKRLLALLTVGALLLGQGMPASVKAAEAEMPENPLHHCTKDDYTDWSYIYFGSYPQTEVTEEERTTAITEADYDSNGDADVDGTKYRRISESDTNNENYFGNSEYRYFKWEPIKWRVLKNDGSTLFVVADKGIDCKDYNEEYTSITWESCTLRNWLNHDFYNLAFSSSEQEAIVQQNVVNEDNPYYNTEGGNNTTDKIYLLSIGEVTNPEYGFCEDDDTESASRFMQTSDYAHTMGANSTTSEYEGNYWWWLRSPGRTTDNAAGVYDYGYVDRSGNTVNHSNDAVVPALHINLSSDLWTSVDDGTGGEGASGGTSEDNPANPVHQCREKDDRTDWNYIYFGSYPQTEVTGDALTSAITGAAYNTNGDAWVNGTKYRRISKSDTNNSGYFGNSEYRYFKWERIKWRVLNNDGSTLFVAADKGIDCKDYHDLGSPITWENCTLRNWLNHDFYGTAFSGSEQEAIVQQNVVNEDNPYYNTEGGNNTTDKVYLLSIGEVINPEYGFCEEDDIESASRFMQTSDYAHAMGANNTSSEYEGNCWWWLRSPGNDTNNAAIVGNYGYVYRNSNYVNVKNGAVVPALHINLLSELWYVEDDGTSGEGGSGDTSGDNPSQPSTEITNPPKTNTEKPDNQNVSSQNPKIPVKKISISAISKEISAGKKVTLTVTVSPKDATNSKVNWSASNKKYATVNSKGVVTTKKAGKGKTVTITATAADGSGVKASIKLKLLNSAVTKVQIKNAPKTLKVGKSTTLKATVKTNGKNANKTLKWTTSNKKYATVTSKGKVTAKKAGKGKTVTITATSTDGTNKKAKVKIKIK